MLACDQQRFNNRVGPCPLRPPLKPATVYHNIIYRSQSQFQLAILGACILSQEKKIDVIL